MDTKPGPERDRGGSGSGRRTAVDLMEPPAKRHMIPVWFFIGVILLLYGIMICVTGIDGFSSPSGTVLANLHAPVWWGAVLAVVGAIYTVRFWPRKS